MSTITQLMMDVEDADENGIDTISVEVEGAKRLATEFEAQDARIAELTTEVAQADRTIARFIAESKDNYVPTDDEVIAWMRRSEIDESHIEHWRIVIDDARSMHLLARDALRESKP